MRRDNYPGVGRSREGAWIEINGKYELSNFVACRSREGAWIEIKKE